MACQLSMVAFVGIASVAMFVLQGCGSSSPAPSPSPGPKPGPSPSPKPGKCDSADLWTFPSQAAPTGEVIFLQFGVEQCASDLDKVMNSDTAKAAIIEVAGNLIAKKSPEVPSALLDAAKSLCSDSCHKNLATCKRGETGAACDPTQTTFYTQLFSYICSKEPTYGSEGNGIVV